MFTIALVAPHALIRSGIRALLDAESGFEVVVEAATVEDAMPAVRRELPDVVLLDCEVPGMGVIEGTRRLSRVEPAPAVVAIGVPPESPLPGCLLTSGANGCLTRECPPDELAVAIRSTAGGQRYVGSDLARRMVLDQLEPGGTPIARLSPRELAVMVMVSQGQCRAEISERLCVSPKTVSTYRTRLMRKLGAGSDVELTHLSLRHGLISARGEGAEPRKPVRDRGLVATPDPGRGGL